MNGKKYTGSNMIRWMAVCLMSLLLFSVFLPAAAEPVPAEPVPEETGPAISLSAEEVLIAKGRSERLTVDLGDLKAKPVWESDDPSVATVSNGYVTGKANGTASVKCSVRLENDEEISAVCLVTVYTPVQTIKAPQTLTIDIGQETDPVELAFTPKDATFQDVEWTSDNEEIAVVDENGQIMGIAEGTCKIYATSVEPVTGSGKPKAAMISVKVHTPVALIELDGGADICYKGRSVTFKAVVLPEDATSKKVTWSVSDKAVASVSTTGVVTGKAGGQVTVSCSAVNNSGEVITAEVDLTVVAPVLSITAGSTQNIVNVGMTSEPLALKIQPADASCRDVTWASKDETIATVDDQGRVTGVKAGRTSIVVTSQDPYATAAPKTCTIPVTVNQGAEKLELTDKITVAKGRSQKLTWTVYPEDTTNKKIVWTSSNDKVARVSSGSVTAVGCGTCVITATTADGSDISKKCTVTVIQAVTSIQRSGTQRIAITEGKTASMSIKVLPQDATNKKVTWKSDSTWIATVDSTGKVTGKNAGTCNIIATATDGSGKTLKIPVTIEPKVPLDATTFTRSGYFGAYYEFAVTFKNLTKTRTIKYIQFDLKYTYSGKTNTYTGFYTNSDTLGPGATKKIGWWDQLGYRLSYCSNFRVYLRSVKYNDGTWDYFDSDSTLIGWFN